MGTNLDKNYEDTITGRKSQNEWLCHKPDESVC